MAYIKREPGDEPNGKGGKGDDGFRPSGKQIAGGILILLVLIFSAVNLDEASVDLVFTSVQMPLVFVIIGSLVIGFGAGYLIRGRRDKRDND